MAVNKVQKSTGDVIIDLTGDTIRPDVVAKGYTGHGPDGVQFTGTMEAASGPVIPAELCPQIVCADNHLRDIVIEDGVPCVRIGFFDIGRFSKVFRFSVTSDISWCKQVVIGCGGYGGKATSTSVGGAGSSGQKMTYHGTLRSGSYTVHCGYDTMTELMFQGSTLLTADSGTTPSDGYGNASSGSGVPGDDGYMMDLQPARFIFDGNLLTAETGAGIGAGGGGAGLDGVPYNTEWLRHGLGGGVFLYVPL